MSKTLLIIDDDKEICQIIRRVAEAEGWRCSDFQSGGPAVEFIERHGSDVVLLDLALSGESDGMAVLDQIKKIDKGLPVIILTGNATVKAAVSAIKAGAFHYLTKPFDNEEMMLLIKKAAEENEKYRQIEILKARSWSVKVPPIIGHSEALKTAQDVTDKIAPTELTVIIQGESGSGKEAFARRIHSKSPRKDGPFVSLDCGTLQESLFESELFGHEKGAFTGADKKKLGQFEIASGGTLFLDEIGNLPLSVQAKLLRVLQERKIQHLGGQREIEVDVRMIVASNQSLQTLLKEGKFREDLFHRLNEFTLPVPPLRKRLEDIPDLADYFLKNANFEMKKTVRGFRPQALAAMKSYSWPGNIRELKNAVYRAALLADDFVEASHLQLMLARDKYIEDSFQKSKSGQKVSLKKASRHAAGVLEKQLIEQVLKQCKNNKSLAAKRLKIDRKALYNKLKKYKILKKTA